MNERLKELAEQSGMEWETQSWCWLANPPHLERFADLVRQDERTSNSKNIDVTDLVLRAKAEEREACAKLCESMGVHPALNVWGGGPDWYKRQKECAKAIRARGEPDPAFKNYMGDNWAGIV
jgi:hypothetical protein